MAKKTGKKKKQNKITDEKPISLYPLKPEEVLKKLLQIPVEKRKGLHKK